MIYLALVCSVTPAWVFFETLRINLSFLQHILAAADMGKGSRGGGYHLQGLHAGAVVLTLAALVHLLRVTAKRVTINNEVGSKRWQCAGDLYLEAYNGSKWTNHGPSADAFPDVVPEADPGAVPGLTL